MHISNWKPIEGFEGYYEISDSGVIRTVPRTKITKKLKVSFKRGKIVPVKTDAKGKRYVRLTRPGHSVKWFCGGNVSA